MRFRPGIVNPIFLREAMLKSPADPAEWRKGMEKHKRDFQLSSDVQWMSDGLVHGRREEADIEETKMKRS